MLARQDVQVQGSPVGKEEILFPLAAVGLEVPVTPAADVEAKLLFSLDLEDLECLRILVAAARAA